MKHLRLRSLATSVLAVSALAGCGGGGDTTTAPPPSEGVSGYPAAGAYGYTVKASGPTTDLRHGLSLLHPALPENEYVIETATRAITDTRLVVSGSVNAAQATVANLQPHALFYIFGGDVRSVPMQADSTRPQLQVRRTDTSSACRFLLAANDHAQPDNSRFIVSTAGADGVCGNIDDGRAEVRSGPGNTLVSQVIVGDAPLEVSRDPATLAPRGWIYPREVRLWGSTAPTTIPLRAAGTPALTQVLASTPQSALVGDGTRLSVISFTGTTATETPLDAALTAGTHWRLVGFDADHFYVYDDNPDHVFTSPWRVLRISKVNPTAVLVGSGTGVISVASMGGSVIFLTVFQADRNLLVRVPKTGGMRFESPPYPITTKPTVQTSAAGRHLLWEVSGVGTAAINYRIAMIDESAAVLQDWPTGAFPISTADAGTESLNVSENRTRFLLASGFGARAFSNASLVCYDATTGVARTLGTLPEYGSDFVFASALGGPGNFGAGFATRSSAGNYVEQSARVYSYDLGAAGSLRTATRR
ncbi:hypothetical protein LRS03_03230 [Rhizobacter sp. J219]|uniref:hypothetical protein n=1 Tax=Rhizobacter sp. J219 TaxID=2898430 RepID=UPI002150F2F4|nr:hypothetical protein [Rhizobacter sp. J219]MCR5881925.1 hypothetical protein [Rhizobacter sp. J219]